jgi:hypothetical protein
VTPSVSPSRNASRAGTGVNPTVRLNFEPTAGCPSTWTAHITVTVEGNAGRDVHVTWWTDTRQQHQQTAARTGDNSYQAIITGLQYGTETFFHASVTTVDDRNGVSGIYPVTARCR